MENIQVAIRVRPLNKKELSRNDDNIWEIPNTDTIALSSSNSREYFASKKINCTGRTSFYFDHCFSTERDNIQVYQQVAKRIVLSSLNGINGTIFMYGQTGSGKTYTMMGLNKNQEEEHDTSVHSRGTSPFNRSSTPPRKQPSKKNLPIAGEIYEIEEKPSHGNYIITDITENTGILVLALRDIFDTIEKDMDKTFFLRCSYVEIYNDQIYDLLKSAERMSEVLSVNEDPNKDFYIKGLTEESVSSIEEILDKLKKGEANRHIARTTMNHSSSRSHTIFRLTVQSVTNNYIREYRRENCKNSTNINNIELKSKFGETGDQNSKTEGTTVTESLLNFVDLAGSEKVSNHQMLLNDPEFMNVDQGGIYGRDSMMAASKLKERVKEGQHINKSLFFLTQVISLKSEGKSNQHIPYRNSPLTKILRSSLGGNSRTLIILCLTPVASQFEQTMSTLRFGMNAKKIENKVQANIITRDDDVGLKMLIADYEKKLKDSESARQEEQAKSAALLRQIEELQLHKSALIERLGSLCKSRITKMAESVTEEDLSSFYKQVQQRNTYFDKVGVVFSSKDLKKYDHLLESSTHHDVSIKRNAQKGRRSSQVQEDDLDLDDERTVTQVKKNVMGHQNKIEESLSKFYAKLYKAHKEQNTILIKKLNVLQKNMQVLCERNLENYNNYIKFSAKSQTRSDQLKEVVAEFQLEIERSNQLQASLDLYKNLKGMTDLNDNDISDLEKHFWERLDQIKMERAKRMVIKEMSSMKDSSDCTKESIDSPKESSGSERRINFQAFLSLDEPSELGDNNEEASKQGQEELNIKEIISQGLEDIDRELEKNKRILLETKEILCPEEAEESKRVGRSLRTERGERNGRETSAASSPTKTPARNSYANISGGKGASSSKKKSPRIQAEALPKLDLGAYLSNITVEPNLPKLSINPMSTKRLSKPEIMSPQISQFEVSSGREQQEELGEMKKEPDHESNKVEDGNMETKETNPRPEKSLNSSLLGPQDGPALFIRHSNIPKPRNLSQAGKGEENKEKGNSQLAPKDNSSITSSKIPSPTRPEKPQVQANNELAVLQNKLTKHLTSLEKYLAKPSSASRRSRSMRTEIISFTQTNQTANSNNESVLTPSRPRLLKEETGVLSRNKEGEFEYQEDSEGEHKMKENKKTSTSEKNSKPYSDLKSRRYTKEMNDSDFLEIGNGEEMRHGEMLNLTNIEKEETIFSTSIFSIKDFDGLNKEKDHDNFPENNVLKQLDNILGKGEHEFEFDACLNQQMNDSRKRRKRAERLQRMENDS